MTAGFEGSVIDGRFELLERLGGGGMGLVWRARDIVLHREVALKEVRPPDPELLRLRPDAAEMLRKRVLREAVSLARITHPNVVTIHHIVSSTEVEHPWLVMELVHGGSLQDRLERGLYTPTEAARLGRGVLAGLQAAHEADILHRDVKPGNVLLRTDGTPLLTDFGIAAVREATSLTNTGELVGSPDYMAPERLRGHDDDPSSDLWSLAMMLYVAVEGHNPMRRSSTLATLAAILEEDVPPPQRADALGPVLRSVLIKDVASRPDAEHLDQLLAQAAGDRALTVIDGVTAPPVPTTGPAEADGKAEADAAGAVPVAYTRTESSAPAPPEREAATTGPPPKRDRPPAEPKPAGAPSAPEETDGRGNPAARTSRTPLRGASADRTRRRVLIPGVLLAVLAAGLLANEFIPGTTDDDKPSGGAAPTHSAPRSPTPTPSPSRTSSPSPSPTPTTETDLLTPSGGRRLVKKMKAVTGRTEVLWLDLHPSRATGNVIVKAGNMPDGKVFDGFDYRDGRGNRHGNEGLVNGQRMTDLSQVDWDALPRLLHICQTELGVRKADPDASHVIFAWNNGRPAMEIYASGAYQTSATLIAGLDGEIIKRNKAE
ncbi:protein kinase [Streptomyces castrisilvae]|uniref:non-specific serine/threonine protein kinase n=1 Tax=Streptomyces castrisilvae TaxID=3033811 RepID=A0ABY9HK62_9ACTN|nr:serine/threonine protein kinase [Streptomyces sp. Mut1]WLQ34467.1 protein kinase [Streptomyces sp. Mut1]